jgi:voltage-gated potassium channel
MPAHTLRVIVDRDEKENSIMYARLARELAGHYGFLLALILADYLLLSLFSGNPAGRVVTNLVLSCTLLVTLLTARAPRRWIVLAFVFIGASVLVLVTATLTGTERTTSGLALALAALALLATPVIIARDIIRSRLVTVHSVMGAMCVYLLVGIIFALLYGVAGSFMPAGFFGTASLGTVPNYLFFSFMTLTTVGYGNLIPAAAFGQSLAMLEAILGQVYLIIVVARLVSLWGQDLPARAPRVAPSSE